MLSLRKFKRNSTIIFMFIPRCHHHSNNSFIKWRFQVKLNSSIWYIQWFQLQTLFATSRTNTYEIIFAVRFPVKCYLKLCKCSVLKSILISLILKRTQKLFGSFCCIHIIYLYINFLEALFDLNKAHKFSFIHFSSVNIIEAMTLTLHWVKWYLVFARLHCAKPKRHWKFAHMISTDQIIRKVFVGDIPSLWMESQHISSVSAE